MVRLRHGRYDAGAERPGDAEWPPHPARVFCALAASGTIADRPGSWAVYETTPLGDPGAGWQLRVPYPGYSDELEAAYRDSRRSWEVARVLPYTVTDDPAGAADGGTGGQPAAVRG